MSLPTATLCTSGLQTDGMSAAMKADTLLHYEDFPEGEVVTFGAYEVTREDVVAYAAEFDPQPFHLDEEAARQSILGGLCASGWHTCAMLMRMMCDEYMLSSASMGSFGVEDVKWLRPVMVGDTLSCRRTTLDARTSSKRPDMGIVRFRWEVLGKTGDVLMDVTGVNLFRVRNPAGDGE